ncbi:MAG: transcription termination/antitermination protein NusA [Archaeoglobi archaeon]|nr:NusA-like transcription termination signal-binding factor [Candidatus Mnemosynella bozhongmuii]MDI3501937.1 transcription termination/antitermination protein NusA [Archaeoglobi archaeon]MDK2781218.1 transcription termination/antitermination protein NusA [Archaeoglobi archaeon]
MAELRITEEEMRYISLFETLTGISPKDCFVDGENGRVVYVVKKGMAGLAIGRGGSTVERVRKALGMNVEIVEHSEDLEEFIHNLFMPVKPRRIRDVRRGGKRIIYVEVSPTEKGIAIGKNGRNIQKVRHILRRHHAVDDVIVV